MTTVKQEEYLLLKILPEQVSDNWDKIAPLIEKSLSPVIYNRRLRMANVLRSVLMEELEVWIYYDSQKRERYLVSTLVRTDPVSLGKDLVIYSFTSVGLLISGRHPTLPELVREVGNGFETLKRYAKANGCDVITAFSDNEQVIKFLSRLGAKVNFTLIRMEI